MNIKKMKIVSSVQKQAHILHDSSLKHQSKYDPNTDICSLDICIGHSRSLNIQIILLC